MTDLTISDNHILTKAELDVQITTAKAYPRNTKQFIEKVIELATMNQDIAESCIYCLVRTDKDNKKTEIKGPSIRLAEIAASCWGNLHAATRIVENDGSTITAEAVGWDLENNLKIVSQVKRSILTRSGHTYSVDMQNVTANAACAIALRNVIFKVIFKAYIDIVYDAIVKFIVGDQKTIDTKRKTIFDRFNKMGIHNTKIYDFFGKYSIDEFGPDDLTTLIGIGTAIKDNMISIDSAFSLDELDNTEPPETRLKRLVQQISKKEAA